MASGRQECSICMDKFKNPKLISCHHSFCYKCLDDYIQVNLRNGRFDCPICRASVELPKSGVSGFQTNFYIEETDSNEKFYCDLCGSKNVACSRCLDCEENLCQSCCFAHEKSKMTRNHKICDLGTLDAKIKGKIRQRIFCDQHPADDIRLFCRDCKVLICVICKVINHEIHATKHVDDAAAEVKKSLQTKLNECSHRLRRIDVSKQKGNDLDRCINDAEREELKAVEDQHLQLNKVLDQEVAKVKAKIQHVYHDLRQQNAVFTREMQDDFKTCSNARDNAQHLVDHGTVIDILKKGPELDQLVSAVISKTDKTPNTRLERKLFSPVEIKPEELISLVGLLLDSTEIIPQAKSGSNYKVPLRFHQKKPQTTSSMFDSDDASGEFFPMAKEAEDAAAKLAVQSLGLDEKDNSEQITAMDGKSRGMKPVLSLGSTSKQKLSPFGRSPLKSLSSEDESHDLVADVRSIWNPIEYAKRPIPPKVVIPNEGSYIDVHVIKVYSPSHFVCILYEQIDHLNQLLQDMLEYFTPLPQLVSIDFSGTYFTPLPQLVSIDFNGTYFTPPPQLVSINFNGTHFTLTPQLVSIDITGMSLIQ